MRHVLPKYLLITICFFGDMIAKPCMAQAFEWLKSTRIKLISPAPKISSDDVGNIYILGHFEGTAVFGTQTLNASNGDGFIAKYGSDGVLQWNIQIQNAAISSLKASSSGVYLCGHYSSSATVGDASMSATGSIDGFILRLNGAGTTDMIIQVEGPGDEYVKSVDADQWGNLYATGIYDTLSIMNSDTLHGTAKTNYFLAKFDSLGNTIWQSTGTQKQLGVRGTIVSVQKNGNSAFVVGYASGSGLSGIDSVYFSNSDIYLQTGPPHGYFVAEYNGNGVLLSVKKFYGGNHWDFTDIDVDKNGNLFQADLNHYSGFWIRKYSPGFILQWSHYIKPKIIGLHLSDIEVDHAGNLYVTGSFSGKIFFPGDTLENEANIQNPLLYTSYVARFNSTGAFQWHLKLDGNNDNAAIQISCDTLGNVFMTGAFNDTLSSENFVIPALKKTDQYFGKINSLAVPLSFKEIEFFDSYRLFPNPTPGLVTIKALQFKSKNPVDLFVYNSKGQFLFNQKVNSETANIDLSQQPIGMYFLHLKGAGTIQTFKVIKEN